MIKKISKLKRFGIFHEFTWKADLPEFKKFNLIYGWNRSGKTTISRVFSSCEKKMLYDEERFNQYPKDGEFEIKTSDDIIKSIEVSSNPLQVKVFNQDFVDDNISFDPSGDPCNPILYVSEEDIESKKKLQSLKNEQEVLLKNYDDAKKDRAAKEQVKTVFLKSLGVTVSNIIFDKTYNKTDAEDKIKKIGVDNFKDKLLSDSDKKKYDEFSKSKAGVEQSNLSKFQINFSFDGKNITNFEDIFSEAKTLMNRTVVSETLERLKNNQDLNAWVKQGFDLHKTMEEKEKCLFCQKPLDNGFLDLLSKHFSKDYEDLQNSILRLKAEILKLKQGALLKNDALYPDLRSRYEGFVKDINSIITDLNEWVDKVLVGLQKKFDNPLSLIDFKEEPKTFKRNYSNEVTNAVHDAYDKSGAPFGKMEKDIQQDFFDSCYNEVISSINQIIAEHNKKVINHAIEVVSAREKLELHSIAIALSTQDYKKFDKDLSEAESKEVVVKNEVEVNKDEVLKLEQKTSNIGKAIGEINKHLKEFFGKEEIKLELDVDKKGYIIQRNGQPAANLSEGEKTAIAFSYFIVKVEEKEFKVPDGIIFVDDPISSFDSNFIYHCFSLLNNHFKESKQLFISTHNFQLFNLVKDWFLRNNKNRKSGGKDECCGFYMVENFLESNVRGARLIELDNTLRDFKSEYHFLFSLLYKFKDTEPKYSDFYTIGNVARRFFDIFADFKIPDSRDQKQKLEAIVKDLNSGEEKVTDVECDKAYKLINEFSHNSDPTSAIEHKEKSESKEAIAILLKIVEKSEPKHYKILSDSLVKTS